MEALSFFEPLNWPSGWIELVLWRLVVGPEIPADDHLQGMLLVLPRFA